MFEGEAILSGANPTCCGEVLPFQVLHTPAGYYVGTFCNACGPHSRETDYFKTNKEAEHALTEFNGLGEMLPDKRTSDHDDRG